jgi:hypothetical protein
MSLIKRMVQKNLEIEEKSAKCDDSAKTNDGKAENEEKSIEEKDAEDDDEEEEEEDVEEEFVESEESGQKMTKKSEKVSSSPSTSMEEKSITPESNQSRGPKDVPKKEENQQIQQQQKRRRDISVGPGKSGESVGQGPDNQPLLRLLEQGEQVNMNLINYFFLFLKN